MTPQPVTLAHICRARRGLPPRNRRAPLWPLAAATLALWLALALCVGIISVNSPGCSHTEGDTAPAPAVAP
jgi:hypothetical protein